MCVGWTDPLFCVYGPGRSVMGLERGIYQVAFETILRIIEKSFYHYLKNSPPPSLWSFAGIHISLSQKENDL